MATRTVGDIVLLCQRLLGIWGTGDSVAQTAVIRDLIDMSHKDICNEFQYDWLEDSAVISVPAGTTGVTFSDTAGLVDTSAVTHNIVANVVHVEDANGYPLRYRPSILESFVAGGPSLQANLGGVSGWWGTFGRTFYLSPPPVVATTAKIYFVASPVDLTADGQFPLIPAKHRQILAYYAILGIVSTDLTDGRKQAWARERIQQCRWDMPKSNIAWPQYRSQEQVFGEIG